jgi:two-component system NarL family sensor kinase
VLGEVRRISHDLRPTILDDLGLAAALDHLAAGIQPDSAAPAHFSADGSMSTACRRWCARYCSASPRKR